VVVETIVVVVDAETIVEDLKVEDVVMIAVDSKIVNVVRIAEDLKTEDAVMIAEDMSVANVVMKVIQTALAVTSETA
jgi:hypothetical protein